MSDNNEHQRFLKQQELQEKRIAFYRDHGYWPKDKAPATPPAIQQDDPLDYLFEPRD